MKKIITTLALAIIMVAGTNAQIIIDDFTTGALPFTTVTQEGEKEFNQRGNKILNGSRLVILKIGENPDTQFFQTTIIKGRLITSMGYGIIGAVELRYGYNSKEKLNQDLSTYKSIKIAYEAKSNFGRVYVDLFSNGPNRAFWRGGGDTKVFKGSLNPSGSNNNNFEITIPLADFTSAQDNAGVENKFRMSDVDYFKFHFMSQGLQGINFAIKKIWIE